MIRTGAYAAMILSITVAIISPASGEETPRGGRALRGPLPRLGRHIEEPFFIAAPHEIGPYYSPKPAVPIPLEPTGRRTYYQTVETEFFNVTGTDGDTRELSNRIAVTFDGRVRIVKTFPTVGQVRYSFQIRDGNAYKEVLVPNDTKQYDDLLYELEQNEDQFIKTYWRKGK